MTAVEEKWIRTFDASGRRAAASRYVFRGIGIALSLAVLVLPPVSEGAHPMTVHRPPYAGSTSSPTAYTGFSGCARSVNTPLKWNSLYGVVKGKNHANALTCGGAPKGPAIYDSAFAFDSISVVIPFRVPHSGNNSIEEKWIVKINASQTMTGGGCPNKTVNYHPSFNNSSEGYCESFGSVSFVLSESLVDLNNGSFSAFNYSSFANDTSLQWQNDTLCTHYRKAVSCLNNTGWSNSSFQYGQNEHDTGFTYAGKTVLHMWTNGTGMLAAHTYGLVVAIQIASTIQLSSYHLTTAWIAAGSTTFFMGVPGNGARLAQITIT